MSSLAFVLLCIQATKAGTWCKAGCRDALLGDEAELDA